MSEVIVRSVRPDKLGEYQDLARDFLDVEGDSATSGSVVAYVAEVPDATPAGDEAEQLPTKPVAMVVCRWGGPLQEPSVHEVITPAANGSTYIIYEEFERRVRALSQLTGLSFPE